MDLFICVPIAVEQGTDVTPRDHGFRLVAELSGRTVFFFDFGFFFLGAANCGAWGWCWVLRVWGTIVPFIVFGCSWGLGACREVLEI